jgi:hypothetical protein
VAAVLIAVATASAAQAATQLGTYGNLERFESVTGQHSQVGLVIVGWNQTTFDQIWPTLGPVPMLGFDTGANTITPRAIARGMGDGFLLAMSASARALGRTVYIRPMAEMNGHWNAASAYNQDGSLRSTPHSTASFRQAFARIYLIMHGGRKVNSTLKRLGLAPVAVSIPPDPHVIVVWNPQGFGSPDVPGNSAQAYYPGNRFVDMVGDDLYDIRGKAEWAAADALYKAHPTKPFAFPEWGLWGIDDPAFVEHMATFVKTHRRTKVIVYYNAKAGSIFDLQSKPASLAAYKRYILPLG